MVARWIPSTTGVDWESLCVGAGIVVRTVPSATFAYCVQLPSGPLFLLPAWAPGEMRQALLCRIWCEWVVSRYGAGAVLDEIRRMVEHARRDEDEDEARVA